LEKWWWIQSRLVRSQGLFANRNESNLGCPTGNFAAALCPDWINSYDTLTLHLTDALGVLRLNMDIGTLRLAGSCLLLVASAFTGRAFDLMTNAPMPTHIVTLRPDADSDSLVREKGMSPRVIFRHAFKGFAAALNAAQIQRLREDARVLAIEPNGKAVLAEQTIPAGLARMGLTNFPIPRINGVDERINVDVAVLDSGIDPHPDLNVVVRESFNVGDPGGDCWDTGHGTQVAGIIGALDNDFGVVGVAPGVRLWSLQIICPGDGNSSWVNILAGMDYVAEHSDAIEVVNASFTSNGALETPFVAISQSVSNIVSKGVVFVAAAGNFNLDISGGDLTFGTYDDLYPAALPEAMAVGAMDPETDTWLAGTDFSSVPRPINYVASPGLCLDVTAPGLSIFTTGKGGTETLFGGTSASAPHVAGLVALYIAANGRATNAAGVYRIRQAIVDNSLPQSQWHPPGNNTQDPDDYPEPLAIPSEQWVPTPTIVTEKKIPAAFQLSFTTVPGYRYTGQFASSLGNSIVWTDLASTNGTGNIAVLSDPATTTTRFYRIQRQRLP
jgi:hypothetical protein